MHRRPGQLRGVVGLLALFAGIAFLPALAVAERTVGTPVVSPSTIPVGQTTELTVTSQITSTPPDLPVLPRSVRLLRLDAAGKIMATLGIMHDDGTNGDVVAGDGIFTLQLSVTETTPGEMRLQTSARFEGRLRRSRSQVAVVPIIEGDFTPPRLGITPGDGTTVDTTAVQITVTYADAGSGVDIATFAAKLDGYVATAFFTITESQASYMASLTWGQHVVEASIRDKDGNQARATSKFTVAVFRALPEATPTSGVVPLTVTFTTKAEYTGGTIQRYRWDFEGDGIFDTSDPGEKNYTFTYTQKGTFNPVLEVLNDKGQLATATVRITVGGNPPVAAASVNPSNGPVPLTVNFTGSGSDKDGTIVKFEWDFEGDGIFDFTSTTTGNTTHTYTAQGIYNAIFRVTDNDGLTAIARATTTAVRAGLPHSPTATITAPSSPVSCKAPCPVSFVGTGSDPDGPIVKFEWDFDGDGTFDASSASASYTYRSPGTFTAVLRVTDDTGLTGIDTIDITVDITVGLSIPNNTCRPTQGGTVTVNTTLSGTTAVTLFLKNGMGQLVRILVDSVTRPAGSYTDVWDCKDVHGMIVQEGVYFGILQYVAGGEIRTVNLALTTGGELFNPPWTMGTTKLGPCSTCPFKPFESDFMYVDFTLSKASEVSVSIRLFFTATEVVSLLYRRLFGQGTHRITWDGTDGQGRVVLPPPGEPQFLFGMTAFTLPDNGIFVEVAPELSHVAVAPGYFNPSTGDFLHPGMATTKMTYDLSKDATVTLQVFNTTFGRLVRTLVDAGITMGTHTLEWDGRNERGIFVDSGDYRLALKAIDARGNASIVLYAPVRVFQ